MNLKRRLEKLERKKGMIGKFPIVFIVQNVFSDGDGHEMYLTPEEEAALEEYKEKMTAAATPGDFVVIYWTREQARELLAQGPCNQAPETGVASQN